ncbi:MAG: ATP synthase F1 subunit delta [Clostridia bacterium]|nr:ATP synthase F1 subunit delta [Clostridia bacterium]
MSDVVKEYSRALVSLAVDEGIADSMLYETRTVRRAFSENPGYGRLLSDPQIPKEERSALLSEALSGACHPYLVNYLRMVAERGYARHIPTLMAEYERLYCEQYGIVTALAVSAVPLTEEQKRRLTDKVSEITGRLVSLRCEVDPSLIGGVRLTVQNTLFEGSVRAKLDQLRGTLKSLTV